MSKNFSLQTLMNLAQHQTDTAIRKLGELNRLEKSVQEKLDMLMEYRKDYQSRLQVASQNGMDPAGLRNFQQFIYKIDAAIEQQRRALTQSQASTQRGRTEFDSTQRKLKSYDTLKQRHIVTQQKVAEKSEQRAQDEHTGRASARKMLDKQNQ
ncbi:MAG: flagellar export protein FliJ [Gallionella sp.]|nr:flagellar export protein FliJ [Gallionella sp.]